MNTLMQWEREFRISWEKIYSIKKKEQTYLTDQALLNTIPQVYQTVA